jgi:cell division protein FtsW (lipid II flippase)
LKSNETESQPLKEKLLPQVSIKFLFALMTLCALLIVLFQASASNAAFWTKIGVMLFSTALGSFVLYAMMFVLANLIAKTTQPLVDVFESPSAENADGSAVDSTADTERR